LDVSLDHKKIAFSKGSRDWYTIYTPRFRGGGFIADAPLRQSLETRFLNKIKSIPGKKAICSTTTQAMSFVHSISHELTGSEIVTMDFTASSATDHKIILFDLVVNTGRSFYESYQAFVKQKGYAPYACATILFNDYLPKPYREDYELWSYKMFYEKPTTSIYILTVTDLIPYFEEYISEPLLNIRKRLINQEAYSINLGDESASLYHAWVDKNYRIEP
jgi:hypothetical protein